MALSCTIFVSFDVEEHREHYQTVTDGQTDGQTTIWTTAKTTHCDVSLASCSTSSSAVAKRPRDASCLSVVNFNSIQNVERNLLLLVIPSR